VTVTAAGGYGMTAVELVDRLLAAVAVRVANLADIDHAAGTGLVRTFVVSRVAAAVRAVPTGACAFWCSTRGGRGPSAARAIGSPWTNRAAEASHRPERLPGGRRRPAFYTNPRLRESRLGPAGCGPPGTGCRWNRAGSAGTGVSACQTASLGCAGCPAVERPVAGLSRRRWVLFFFFLRVGRLHRTDPLSVLYRCRERTHRL